jgi:hypothetical protein
MSFGIGLSQVPGYGDADSWGGPADGIDVQQGIGNVEQKRSAKVPSDTYMFLVVVGALGVLWLLGGVAFKSARM